MKPSAAGTTAELAKMYDICPAMIMGWKRIALQNMATVFDGKNTSESAFSDQEVEKLHTRTSQLVVEGDFMSTAWCLILKNGGKKRWSRTTMI